MTKETTSTALVTLQPENELTLFVDGTGVDALLAALLGLNVAMLGVAFARAPAVGSSQANRW